MPKRTSHLRAVTSDDDATELDEHYPDRFLDCRAVGHRWVVIGYFHQGGEVVRSLMCERCDMDRHDYWSPGGTRLRNAYSQPDGYRIGGGGVSKFEVRIEVLNRVTIFDSEDLMHAHLMAARGQSKTAKPAAKKKATG